MTAIGEYIEIRCRLFYFIPPLAWFNVLLPVLSCHRCTRADFKCWRDVCRVRVGVCYDYNITNRHSCGSSDNGIRTTMSLRPYLNASLVAAKYKSAVIQTAGPVFI